MWKTAIKCEIQERTNGQAERGKGRANKGRRSLGLIGHCLDTCFWERKIYIIKRWPLLNPWLEVVRHVSQFNPFWIVSRELEPFNARTLLERTQGMRSHINGIGCWWTLEKVKRLCVIVRSLLNCRKGIRSPFNSHTLLWFSKGIRSLVYGIGLYWTLIGVGTFLCQGSIPFEWSQGNQNPLMLELFLNLPLESDLMYMELAAIGGGAF